ncbi:synaptonemal complex central element protein 3 [Chiloscyllium plagiosum]|uniref:synaptonemal complex central element protein 3 n=1 Tax=Chiloscyllium plagiosum TaxID=36176 RepID=UPI001CB822F5|nr:synaptonemal complex central element protein 3 [Chiloscyllium plagiosum]
MADGCVQGLSVRDEDEALGTGEPKVMQEVECVGGVPNVCGEILDQGGKDGVKMAEGIPCTHEDIIKLLEDTRVELEEMLNELEMLSVQATCMTYDIVILRTDPSVVESMMRLNEAYLNCKESVAKDYMEMLTEPKKNESETV